MIFSRYASYESCDTCRTTMQGIRDRSARTTCHGCGGRALISDGEVYQQQLRTARERLSRGEPPRATPRSPNMPRAA